MHNAATQRSTNNRNITTLDLNRCSLLIDTRSNDNYTAITKIIIGVDVCNSIFNGSLRTANTVTVVIIITVNRVNVDNTRLASKGAAGANTFPAVTIPDAQGFVSVILQPGLTNFPISTRRGSTLDKGIETPCSSRCSKQVSICSTGRTSILLSVSDNVYIL